MHAYLILAHNEFEILQLLIQAIDDERNDIYIHFDKKVKELPVLNVKHAGLHVIADRVDVRWADASMLEAEFILFETAVKNREYDYYHLLSGVDLPLKSQDEIHRFFADNRGKEFIGFYQGDATELIKRRVNYYHLFPSNFRETKGVANTTRRIIRAAFLRFQQLFGLKRNKNIEFKKGTQWISVTHDFVKYLISQKEKAAKIYRYSFCSDELLAQTICWNSPFRNKLYDITDEGRGCMRHIGWKNNQLAEYSMEDLETLQQSEAMFARKFSSKHIDIAKRLLAIGY